MRRNHPGALWPLRALQWKRRVVCFGSSAPGSISTNTGMTLWGRGSEPSLPPASSSPGPSWSICGAQHPATAHPRGAGTFPISFEPQVSRNCAVLYPSAVERHEFANFPGRHLAEPKRAAAEVTRVTLRQALASCALGPALRVVSGCAKPGGGASGRRKAKEGTAVIQGPHMQPAISL